MGINSYRIEGIVHWFPHSADLGEIDFFLRGCRLTFKYTNEKQFLLFLHSHQTSFYMSTNIVHEK